MAVNLPTETLPTETLPTETIETASTSWLGAVFGSIWQGLSQTGRWLGNQMPEFMRQPFYADSEYMQGVRQMFDGIWYGLTHIPEFFRFLLSTLDVSNILPMFGKFSELGASGITAFILKILLGWFLASLGRMLVTRAIRRSGNDNRQLMMLARRSIFYSIFGLFLISALSVFGIKSGAIAAAAGALTLALGFAAQTSVSNLISGFFLLGERVAEIGDIIEVDNSVGEVIAIDLISTKLRTFDNVLIRIPNEKMVNAKIKNMSAFPIRRVDIKVGVAYKEDLEEVRDLLFEVAAQNPLCLAEPKPMVLIDGYGDSAVDLLFLTWASRPNWLELKNQLHIEVKKALDTAGVEIPFPHLSVYSGEVTKPFPMQSVVDEVVEKLEAQETRKTQPTAAAQPPESIHEKRDYDAEADEEV